MKTAEQVLEEYKAIWNVNRPDNAKSAMIGAMKEYAKEVLKDWDEYWKNDGNTHCNGLVDTYIKKRGL